MRSQRRVTLILSALFGLFLTVAPDVFAVVGRPATPGSVAGVARRTTRRTAAAAAVDNRYGTSTLDALVQEIERSGREDDSSDRNRHQR
jgi:hypothetical protein